VPTVSLMGQTRPARESRAILSAVALDDLATNNLSEFVDVSIKLAADQHRLSTLRNTLRDKMRHGPLMDFRRVAREIEDACRWAMANRSS
jgi:predicted O-linked N-acetylglucosamine transferase (SPINDLY family)